MEIDAVLVIVHFVSCDNIVRGPVNIDACTRIDGAQSIMMNDIVNNKIICSTSAYEYAIKSVVVDSIVNDTIIPEYEFVNGTLVFKVYPIMIIIVYNVPYYLVIGVWSSPEKETMASGTYLIVNCVVYIGIV